MELIERFSKVIVQLRRRDNIKLTQEEVAKEAGLTLRYYQKLESGAAKRPSLEVVSKIAKALGMKLSDFCKLIEEID